MSTNRILPRQNKVFFGCVFNTVSISLIMSLALALPAVIYFSRYPEYPNALSLAFSVGFFFAIVTVIRSPLLLLAVALPALALNTIEIVHILVFGGLISLGGIEAIFYVDPHEAKEFLVDKGLFLLPCLLIIPLFWWLAVSKKHMDFRSIGRRAAIGLTAIIVPFAALAISLIYQGSKREVFLPTRILEHYTAMIGINPLTHTLSGISSTIASHRELTGLRAEREGYRFNSKRTVIPASKELYIIIVGESSRKANWQIFGYGRNTNPLLSKRTDLILFQDAISPGTTTSRSIPLSFTLATPETWRSQFKMKSFVSAFSEVGFQTYWLSNQGSNRTAVGSSLQLIMEESDVVRTTNFGFWNSVLDAALLKELDKAIAEPGNKKLVVIHTLGSHTNYRQRYPGSWPLPKSKISVRMAHGYSELDDGEVETINEYDKTISYSDWLVDEIINRHEATSIYGAVIYFSDHGQRLYDDRLKQKGHGFRGLEKVDVEIPLFVWLSKKLKAISPEKQEFIRSNACKPVSTASFAHSIVSLADIEIERSNPHNSFFDPRFKISTRIVRNSGSNTQALDEKSEDAVSYDCKKTSLAIPQG